MCPAPGLAGPAHRADRPPCRWPDRFAAWQGYGREMPPPRLMAHRPMRARRRGPRRWTIEILSGSTCRLPFLGVRRDCLFDAQELRARALLPRVLDRQDVARLAIQRF